MEMYAGRIFSPGHLKFRPAGSFGYQSVQSNCTKKQSACGREGEGVTGVCCIRFFLQNPLHKVYRKLIDYTKQRIGYLARVRLPAWESFRIHIFIRLMLFSMALVSNL